MAKDTTAATNDDKDFDAGFTKPSSKTWKPGKPTNRFKGVYLGFTEKESKYKEKIGQMVKTYEFTGIAGEYNNITHDEATDADVVDEAITAIVKGEKYIIFGGKGVIDDPMKDAKFGQQVVVRFLGMQKPKSGGKAYKNIEVKLGGMDPDWVKENGGEAGDQAF